MSRIPNAADLMHRDVATVTPQTSAADLAVFFSEEGVSGAPVVDDEGRLVGMVSRTDLVRSLAEEGDEPSPVIRYTGTDDEEFLDVPEPPLATAARDSGLTVRDLMSEVVVHVRPEQTVGEVARTLYQYGIHRVVVLEEGRVAGIISTTDLLPVIADLEKALKVAKASTR